MDRAANNQKYPKIHGFNTFFYPTLHEFGYSRLKRWTRKVSCDEHNLLINF